MSTATGVRASIMITCLGDVLFPEVGVAMVRLLRRLGVTVDFPEGQTCCGLPLFNSGYHREAAAVAARATLAILSGANAARSRRRIFTGASPRPAHARAA